MENQEEKNSTENKFSEHSAKQNMPEKKFRAGAISSTVWANPGKTKDGQDITYRTVSIERSYTDKEGKWQNTSSFRANDLPKATLVLQKAYEFIVLKNSEAAESA